jgi:hypothetical protein
MRVLQGVQLKGDDEHVAAELLPHLELGMDPIVIVFFQGCGSGSVMDPDSIGSVDPDPGGQKLPTKVEKIKKINVLKCWMFSFES